jgi:phosphoribosylaminoimidazolecarboxamide formyltransferase/IMP cyclohydrolase
MIRMAGKDPLSTKVVGKHPDSLIIGVSSYGKVLDLRYGTNPTQTAALYNPSSFLGSLKELKTGKEGASQTNMEDIFYAALTVGYFGAPSVIIMKHENPSGFATQYEEEPLWFTYKKAQNSDFRAAFGGTALINRPIDKETAEAIRELFTEVLVAPGFEEGVVDSFKGSIRIFLYDDEKFRAIPRYSDDPHETEIRRFADGSAIRSDPLLTPIRSVIDLEPYIVSEAQPTEGQMRDLLTGYRIRLRSNSVRMVKHGYTTGMGTGQQDRVGCIEIADFRNRRLVELADAEGRKRVVDYSIPGSCLISDGFFPFTDSIELAYKLGIVAVLAPHGGQKFNDVLAKADELGIAFVDLPGELRFFDHH